MNGYKQLIDWIEKAEVFIASFLLGVLACIIMMEVVSRYCLEPSFPVGLRTDVVYVHLHRLHRNSGHV